MRKQIILLLALTLFSSTLWAQKSSLKGTISGLPEGTTCVLGEVSNGRVPAFDTLKLDKNGAFTAKIAPQEPTIYILQMAGSNNALHLMIAPKERVSIELEYVEKMNALKINSCSGSKNVDVYRQFNNLLLSVGSDAQSADLPKAIEELIITNRSSLISAFLVTFFERDMDTYAPLYNMVRNELVKTYPNNPYVKHLNDKLKGLITAGIEAPEIAMKDADGNIRKLSDLRGKVVLIDFWASWCRPCRGENPNVVKMYQKYNSQGFEVFSVSLDSDRNAWLKAIKDDGLIWPNHVSDLKGWTSSGGATYGVSSIPATVLVDRSGKVIARNLRGPQLEQALKELFGN